MLSVAYASYLYLLCLTWTGNAYKLPENVAEKKPADLAMGYLSSFGYMPKSKGGPFDEMVDESTALKKFQRFMGLNETGQLDNVTLAMMLKPRCGVKDISSREELSVRRKRYELQGSKWNRTTLTWKVVAYSKSDSLIGVSRETIDGIFAQAFSVWEKNSCLQFRHAPQSSKVDITIGFQTEEHGDGRAFDGPGFTLAHAFYPDFGGSVHFDDTEMWIVKGERGVDLLSVAVHELGHSLGLRHSDVRGAVMYPTYAGKRYKLAQDDIEAINVLYPVGSSTSLANSPTSHQMPDNLCADFSIDAATCLKDHQCFFFKDKQVFKVPDSSSGKPEPAKPISEVFPRLKQKVDAAVTDVDGFTYLFVGPRVWVYKDPYNLPIKENETISLLFPGLNLTSVDAAFRWGHNGKLYFFKQKSYWKYERSKNPPVDKRYPMSVTSWYGLPNKRIDAAFQWSRNRKSYFFHKDKFWKFDDNKQHVAESKKLPYPRESSQWWMNCEEMHGERLRATNYRRS